MTARDWKIVKILAGVATRVYAACGAAFLICFILYCFYGGFLAFCLLGVFTCGILYHAQDNLLYHPDLPASSRVYIQLPSMHNLPYEAINIRTRDNVTLHAFWIRQPEGKSNFVPTFVYFHGNAGNMGHRLQNAWGIFYNLKCNILLFDYRGYGHSTSYPTERALYIDGRSAVDYLYTRHDLDHTKIVLFGRSLGGAVAIDVAADLEYGMKIMCTIMENTFTSIPDMAVELVHPYVKYLPFFMYKNQFNSISKVDRISVPCLFISGLADNLVPPKMMRSLHIKCGSAQKRLLEFSGGSHNDTWIIDGYYVGIADFLSQCNVKPLPLQKPPEKRKIWNEVQEV